MFAYGACTPSEHKRKATEDSTAEALGSQRKGMTYCLTTRLPALSSPTPEGVQPEGKQSRSVNPQ